jgi:hypothetical protein
MRLDNRLRNGYNGARSGMGTLLGALVLYVAVTEKAGEKPTRLGFRDARGLTNANYGKTVIQLGKRLGVIVPKTRSRKGTVYTLGPKASEILAA